MAFFEEIARVGSGWIRRGRRVRRVDWRIGDTTAASRWLGRLAWLGRFGVEVGADGSSAVGTVGGVSTTALSQRPMRHTGGTASRHLWSAIGADEGWPRRAFDGGGEVTNDDPTDQQNGEARRREPGAQAHGSIGNEPDFAGERSARGDRSRSGWCSRRWRRRRAAMDRRRAAWLTHAHDGGGGGHERYRVTHGPAEIRARSASDPCARKARGDR